MKLGLNAMEMAGAVMVLSLAVVALFLVTISVSVCLGHSLGMHRRLIHRAYECRPWLERLFVYLGVIVGMVTAVGRHIDRLRHRTQAVFGAIIFYQPQPGLIHELEQAARR